MLDKTVTDWQAASRKLAFEGRAFINGRYVDALSGSTRPTLNPANGKVLTEVASCGPEDADLAVAGARKVFESGAWSQMAPAARKAVLVRWAGLIEQHAEELALLECLDVGKPISDTLTSTCLQPCAPSAGAAKPSTKSTMKLRPLHREPWRWCSGCRWASLPP